MLLNLCNQVNCVKLQYSVISFVVCPAVIVKCLHKQIENERNAGIIMVLVRLAAVIFSLRINFHDLSFSQKYTHPKLIFSCWWEQIRFSFLLLYIIHQKGTRNPAEPISQSNWKINPFAMRRDSPTAFWFSSLNVLPIMPASLGMLPNVGI